MRLRPDERRTPRAVAVSGRAGCLVLALSLPMESVLSGAVVLEVGALAGAVRRHTRRPA